MALDASKSNNFADCYTRCIFRSFIYFMILSNFYKRNNFFDYISKIILRTSFFLQVIYNLLINNEKYFFIGLLFY